MAANTTVSSTADFSKPGEVFGMWVTALYGGVIVAHGLATHVNQAGKWSANLFARQDVKWEYLVESPTEKEHPDFGEMKCWDVVVDGQPVLKNAAWSFVDPPEVWERTLGHGKVTFRAKRKGDSGFGLKETGEKSGLDIDEAWFG